jgi:hypothetical protein
MAVFTGQMAVFTGQMAVFTGQMAVFTGQMAVFTGLTSETMVSIFVKSQLFPGSRGVTGSRGGSGSGQTPISLLVHGSFPQVHYLHLGFNSVYYALVYVAGATGAGATRTSSYAFTCRHILHTYTDRCRWRLVASVTAVTVYITHTHTHTYMYQHLRRPWRRIISSVTAATVLIALMSLPGDTFTKTIFVGIVFVIVVLTMAVKESQVPLALCLCVCMYFIAYMEKHITHHKQISSACCWLKCC